ncbi:acyl-CoA dehydrogenase [Pseudonocardia sediminis]|uniref:Acyl-CoA dehydrogenase n=1 Tax=Pseudonocardia sediminis TaxID=1397368 RepID=A0A4V2FR59_PSEST|nr:acyl-CoA dehydrogenase family protein [Pseudonocardia sediminis]RZT87320.1 acyl-CoA dehydrogenase [Pseudonocardia sediminis]
MAELLRDTVSALLADDADDTRDEAARYGWSPGLWDRLAAAGLTLVAVPDAAGGSGGTLRDLAVLLHACGYHAAPVPLLENALAAGALAAAGRPVPPGPLVVVPRAAAAVAIDGSGRRATGRLPDVAWARAGRQVVLLTAMPEPPGHPVLAMIDPGDCVVEPGTNIAGEPRDALLLPDDGVACTPLTTGDGPEDLTLRGTLGRALLMNGSLRRVLDLTVRYAGEREQFGRPIGRFQAVQQQLAALAGTVEQAGAIADLAVSAVERDERAAEAVMAAKICAGHAAAVAIAVGHQVHGAIGFTVEHELHRHTRRLMAWRDEDGSESQRAAELGARVTGAGPGGLWELLTGRPAAGAAR